MNSDNLFEISKLADLKEIPIDTFAFIGDAIIELRFKLYLLKDGRRKVQDIYYDSKNYLSAKAHNNFVEILKEYYNNDEKSVYKRAVNSKGAKKKGNDEDYRISTGFEAVVGYLYLKKEYKRLNFLLGVIEECMS